MGRDFRSREVSERRIIPWLLIAGSLALIAFATLTPGAATGVNAVATWPFTTGDTPLTDGCSNVLLFMPLGAALAFGGTSIPVATTVGLLLSLGIELLQASGHPVGRYATGADILANTGGAVVGAVGAAWRGRWLRPTPTGAGRLAAGWTVLVALVVTATAWSLSPVAPVAPVARGPRPTTRDGSRALTAPQRSPLENAPGYPWFAGRVTSAVVSGVRIAHQGTGPVRVQAPGAPVDAVVRLEGHDNRASFVPVLYVHDENLEPPFLLLGQLGTAAALRSPRRGDAIGLRRPQLVIPNVFLRDTSEHTFVARVTSQSLYLRASNSGAYADARLALTPSLGWWLIQPLIGDDEPSRIAATVVWLLLLIAPACYWAWRSGHRRHTIVAVVLGTIVGVFVVTPSVFGIAPLPGWQWGTLLVEAVIGIQVSRLTFPAVS